jgi:hypothetical protein
MNEDLENYDIYICKDSELSELQKFIKDHWKTDHILVRNRKLMDWQHLDRENKVYNFVIAKCRQTKQIHGILGFIPTSHFDKSIKQCDIWLAIWKVKDGIKSMGLGMVLLQFLVDIKKPQSISGYGFNKSLNPILKYFGHKIRELHHYYIVNDRKHNFGLIGNFDHLYYSNDYVTDENKKLIKFGGNRFLNNGKILSKFFPDTGIPTKSFTYYYNRYFTHPIYKYHIYGIVKKEEILGFLVFRLVSHQSNNALRIVDYFGYKEGITSIKKALQKLLIYYDAEYIDFYNLGFSAQTLASSGFIKRDCSTKVIIPNYFEPFEKKNITLRVGYKCDSKYNYFVCKGDGDQDRPS